MRALWEKYKAIFWYLVFGVITTVVNIVTYYLCYELGGVANVPSNVIAWAVAVAVAFVTNKLWVFDSKSFAPGVALPELWKFVSCRLVTGVMDTAIMWVGVDVLGGPGTAVKVGSNALVVVLNYVFSKLIIFKDKT